MRVGLDLLYLVPGQTGGRETYARELVAAMAACSPELELVAFVNRDAGPSLARKLAPGVEAVVVPISPGSRLQWAIGELALLPLAARKARVDIVHSMANFAPAWGPFKRVVTIHDLHYKSVPDLMSRPMRAGTAALVSLAARRADRVIVDSESTRADVLELLKTAPERVDVVPLGVQPPSGRAPDLAGIRERHGLHSRPVLLSVASDLPHKNLSALIDALASMPPESRPTLVMAGHGTDSGKLAAHAIARGVASEVRLLGSCSSSDLEALYAVADCLAFPSLNEGFGLPVLEAMIRDVPVVCSDIPALREVGDEAAVYFDPLAPDQIAARAVEVLRDAALADRMRALGQQRAGKFSWATAARLTLASYRRAISVAG